MSFGHQPFFRNAFLSLGHDPLSTDYYRPKRSINRRAFFSFHFDDVMRVNNVRNAWRAHRRDTSPVSSFTDSSLWESKQLEVPESIKSLIRDGVQGTSAVCVLAGSSTWNRRWVRYEMARSVVDEKGLLAVHLNGINHHQSRRPDPYGPNPLDYMAVGWNDRGQYCLYERVLRRTALGGDQWIWQRYSDYTRAVNLPAYLSPPTYGYVIPLSTGAASYCYAQHDGYHNIGSWIDHAARTVGR